jgi:hypothetical protein
LCGQTRKRRVERRIGAPPLKGNSYMPIWSARTNRRTPLAWVWAEPVKGGRGGRSEGGDRRRRPLAQLADDGEDAAGRGFAGGGESRTSPETGTARLAVASPAEARKRT